jgi:hypothetical protein
MKNKPSLENTKQWFYTARPTYISEVPHHFYKALHSIGLIDADIDNDDYLRPFAVAEGVRISNNLVLLLKAQIKPYIEKPTLNIFQQSAHDKLYNEIDAAMLIRMHFAKMVHNTTMPPPDAVKQLYTTLRNKAAVYYSKPIETITDLDDVGGVGGSRK